LLLILLLTILLFHSIGYATGVIRHLTNIGVVCSSDGGSDKRRVFRPKTIESTLLLSKTAQERIFVPGGILNHHHAIQFLTFSPPMDPNRRPPRPPAGPGATATDDTNSSVTISMDSAPRAQSPASSVDRGDTMSEQPISIMSSSHSGVSDIRSESHPRGKVAQVTPEKSRKARKVTKSWSASVDTTEGGEPQERRRKIVTMVSKLNCCRAQNLNNKSPILINTSALTLTDEQEIQWSSFSIRDIAEDRSLAGRSFDSQSIVSMSAPLLSRSNAYDFAAF
jgi:hypothetical protein